MSDDLRKGRDRPPTDEEWVGVWSALEKADKGWIITGPIYAVVSNWKALSVTIGVIIVINRKEVQDLVLAILRVTP